MKEIEPMREPEYKNMLGFYSPESDVKFYIGLYKDPSDWYMNYLYLMVIDTGEDIRIASNSMEELSIKAIYQFAETLQEGTPTSALRDAGFKVERKDYNGVWKESKNSKNNSLKVLKESLKPETYNRITTLITECLKEGIQVEITIPKNNK
jgi:hypothetical protein